MSVFLIQAIPWGASLIALAASCSADLRARFIPDKFAVLIAVCGLALNLRSAQGQVWYSLLAAASVFLALGVLAHYGFIGGGDVKLIAASALLVPPNSVPLLLAEIALAGGVLSALYLATGFLLRRWPQLYRYAGKTGSKSPFNKWIRCEGLRIARGCPVPYALAVLGGVTMHIMRELPQCLNAISCSL